jgi:hypothetical protein
MHGLSKSVNQTTDCIGASWVFDAANNGSVKLTRIRLSLTGSVGVIDIIDSATAQQAYDHQCQHRLS